MSVGADVEKGKIGKITNQRLPDAKVKELTRADVVYRLKDKPLNLKLILKDLLTMPMGELGRLTLLLLPFIVTPYIYILHVLADYKEGWGAFQHGDNSFYLVLSSLTLLCYFISLGGHTVKDVKTHMIVTIFYPIICLIAIIGFFLRKVYDVLEKDKEYLLYKLSILEGFKGNSKIEDEIRDVLLDIYFTQNDAEDMVIRINDYYKYLISDLNKLVVIPVEDSYYDEFSGYLTRKYNLIEFKKEGVFTTSNYKEVEDDDLEMFSDVPKLDEKEMMEYISSLEEDCKKEEEYKEIIRYREGLINKSKKIDKIKKVNNSERYNKVKDRLGNNRRKERWETRLRDTSKELKKLEEENKKVERLL